MSKPPLEAPKKPVVKEEEPKKPSVYDILVAALEGHGHIYSPEEREALGAADPTLKKEKEAEAEAKRFG